MRLDQYKQGSCYALVAALALAASTALANDSASPLPAPETSVSLAVAESTETMPVAHVSTAPHTYPPLDAGVRRAAAEGPAALHHYIYRTRMIYNYYFWDFAKEE